jgi:hypothetical protein
MQVSAVLPVFQLTAIQKFITETPILLIHFLKPETLHLAIGILITDMITAEAGTFQKAFRKKQYDFGAYLPLGVDFRIGNKRDFWKRIHLFYEARPSINMTAIPELRTITNASIFHGLGVKVKWE